MIPPILSELGIQAAILVSKALVERGPEYAKLLADYIYKGDYSQEATLKLIASWDEALKSYQELVPDTVLTPEELKQAEDEAKNTPTT